MEKKREKREKGNEEEKRGNRVDKPFGEKAQKTDFSQFDILPQADPEALDVIILAGMPGLEETEI